jgi:hypothetical protein
MFQSIYARPRTFIFGQQVGTSISFFECIFDLLIFSLQFLSPNADIPNVEYGFSEEIMNWKIFLFEQMQSVHCSASSKSEKGQSKAFYVDVEASPDELLEHASIPFSQLEQPFMRLNIFSPLILENLLPFDITVKIQGDGESQTHLVSHLFCS